MAELEALHFARLDFKRQKHYVKEQFRLVKWKGEWDTVLKGFMKTRNCAAHNPDFEMPDVSKAIRDITALEQCGLHIAFGFVKGVVVPYHFALALPGPLERLHRPRATPGTSGL